MGQVLNALTCRVQLTIKYLNPEALSEQILEISDSVPPNESECVSAKHILKKT